MSEVVEIHETKVTVIETDPAALVVLQEPVEWVIDVAGNTGPQGPAGEDGADSTVPGPIGPQGAAGPTGATGADGVDGATAKRAVRSDWVSPSTYLGVAPTGSDESAAVWTITRMQILGDGSVVTATAGDVAWHDRLTCVYA